MSFRQIADQILVLNPLPYGGYDHWIEVDSNGHEFGPRPEFPPTQLDLEYGKPFENLTVEEYERQAAEEEALFEVETKIAEEVALLEEYHIMGLEAIKARHYATL